MTAGRPTIGFLYLGGAHQVLHTAPVALELAREGTFDITCFAAEQGEREVLDRLFRAAPGIQIRIEDLPAPWWVRWLPHIWKAAEGLKLPRLLANIRRLRRCDAIVTAERTSTILKRLHLFNGPLIHIPHGAGDRAKGFEKRLRLFDLVITAGAKDATRMVAEKVVDPGRIAVGGPVKLGTVATLGSQPPRFFDNDRPTVLYNPHFDAVLGSWDSHAMAVIDFFAAQANYNLIVAPHVRLLNRLDGKSLAAFKALPLPPHICVDFGSSLSCDMSYTNAADIYLGDVSSQIYEFISRPRPAIFINAHAADWQDDPNYACWHFGDVIATVDELGPTLAVAAEKHAAQYRAVQERAVEQALGTDWANTAQRSAGIIADYVAKLDGDVTAAKDCRKSAALHLH